MTDPQPPPIILIAEDDPDDRLMLREAFAERCHDCQLCFAHDGVQLMEILHGEVPLQGDAGHHCGCPDLILMDLNMPLKDGRQALQEIKNDPRLRRIPTVVMTTSNSDDDIDACYGAGANSYIVKPASFTGLLDVVSSLADYWASTVTLPTRPERHDQK